MNKIDNQRHEEGGKREFDYVARLNEGFDNVKQRMAYG